MSVEKIVVYRDCVCKQAGEVLLTTKGVFIILGQISNKLFCCFEIIIDIYTPTLQVFLILRDINSQYEFA